MKTLSLICFNRKLLIPITTIFIIFIFLSKDATAQTEINKVVGFEEFMLNEPFDLKKINDRNGLLSNQDDRIKTALITHRKFANQNLSIQLFYLDKKLEKIKLRFDNELILKKEIVPILTNSFGNPKINTNHGDTIFYWLGILNKVYYDQLSICKCELNIEVLDYNSHEKALAESSNKKETSHISSFFGHQLDSTNNKPSKITTEYKPLKIPLKTNLDPSPKKEEKQNIDPPLIEKKLSTGDDPKCENVMPMYNYTLNNYLSIANNSNLDVVIKLIKVAENVYTDDVCVRIAFVKNSDIFSIKNIPEGKYYLKIAYGNIWVQGIVNEKCVGKFQKNAAYEKGTQILDYYIKSTERGKSIPSYRLSLKTQLTTGMKFDSNKISEKEFNQ